MNPVILHKYHVLLLSYSSQYSKQEKRKILQSILNTLTFTFVFYLPSLYNSLNYLTKIEGAHDTTALTQVWAIKTRGVSKHSIVSDNRQLSFLAKQQRKRGASVSHQGLISLPAWLYRLQQHIGGYREKARELHRFKQ